MKISKSVCFAALGLIAQVGIAHAVESQSTLTKKALIGDYQAQRNLAYSYFNPRKDEVADPVLGCAWYMTIVKSGSPKVNLGDEGNVKVYCNKLDTPSIAAAMKQSESFLKQIGSRVR
jgi:hypothetical protein